MAHAKGRTVGKIDPTSGKDVSYGKRAGISISGDLFIDRRSKSITRATVEKAWDKIQARPGEITGPKSLGVFGAPYVWAVFKAFGIV